MTTTDEDRSETTATAVQKAARVLDSHFTDSDYDTGCAMRCGYAGDERDVHLAQSLADAGLLATAHDDSLAQLTAVREVFNAWDDKGFEGGGLDQTNRFEAWADLRAALAPKGLT